MCSKNNTTKTKIQVAEKCNIKPWETVTLTHQGEKYTELLYMKYGITPGTKKLNKDEYIVLKTGEVKAYEHRDDKYEESLKKTFNRLRALIRTNFTNEGDNQLMLTLTYAENMMDEKKLMKDFEKFIKRLRYEYQRHQLEYISIAEPQERGAWHMHVLIKTDQPVLYIDNKKLTEIWGNGGTDAERLRSDDCGSYYVAYFTDLIVGEDGKEIAPEKLDKMSVKEKSKKRAKGERLWRYPKHFKFYRTSRGIKQPTVEYCEYKNAIGKLGEPSYEQTYDIVMENEEQRKSRTVNQIHKATYKSKKKK